MLHEIRHPVVAIVHLDVTVWMLIRLVAYDAIADLRNIPRSHLGRLVMPVKTAARADSAVAVAKPVAVAQAESPCI